MSEKVRLFSERSKILENNVIKTILLAAGLAISLSLLGCACVSVLPSAQSEPELAFERHPAVEDLKELDRIEHGRTTIIIRGEGLRKKKRKRVIKLARAIYNDVAERFLTGSGPVDRPPVDLCLFKTQKTYDAFVLEVYGEEYADFSPRGFYMPSKRLIVANLSGGYGNLRHEILHPIMGDDFENMPYWMNEGMASLYGSSEYSKKKKRFVFGINYRLKHLKAAIKADALPSFEELANSTYSDVHERPHTYYAYGRYLLLYLDEQNQLEAFWAEMAAELPTPERQLEVINTYVEREAFLEWVDDLKINWPR